MHKTRSKYAWIRLDAVVCFAMLHKKTPMTCSLQRMRTPLHLAALQGDAASVMGLCTYKAKVNLKDEHALTPLHKAAAQGHNEAAEELLAHNANPDATDEVMFMLPASHALNKTCIVMCQGKKLSLPTAYIRNYADNQYTETNDYSISTIHCLSAETRQPCQAHV